MEGIFLFEILVGASVLYMGWLLICWIDLNKRINERKNNG